jgi:diguanylate cyclase (GGDEF)-like protein
VILDWMMPIYTGPEVCRMVREAAREPYTYILLLTSKSLKEDLITGMESGADDYIVKPFDQHELKVRLRAATRILDLQAELLSAREDLREQATRDSLTRIWNRPAILDIMRRELLRAEREKRPLGVVIADLDHFKSINDTYGHAAGDVVLREAANRMVAACREYDAIGRYGGEEFLILLPGCDESSTMAQAERMRLRLCEVPLSVTETVLNITASFGATSFLPGTVTATAERLIMKADEALYRAKHLGRNRSHSLQLDEIGVFMVG